jgi:hypothetical protein
MGRLGSVATRRGDAAFGAARRAACTWGTGSHGQCFSDLSMKLESANHGSIGDWSPTAFWGYPRGPESGLGDSPHEEGTGPNGQQEATPTRSCGRGSMPSFRRHRCRAEKGGTGVMVKARNPQAEVCLFRPVSRCGSAGLTSAFTQLVQPRQGTPQNVDQSQQSWLRINPRKTW